MWLCRVRFDLRWKLALDDERFRCSSFSRFRSRLAQHGLARYAFDKLVRMAIEPACWPKVLSRRRIQPLFTEPRHCGTPTPSHAIDWLLYSLS